MAGGQAGVAVSIAVDGGMALPAAVVGLCLRDLLDANPVVGDRRVGSKRPWTGREVKVVREHYPVSGLAGCLPLLAGRSATAIYQRARVLGLVSPKAASDAFPRQRWATSEAIDVVIRRAYLASPTRNGIGACAAAVMRPRWWVSRRATQLGLVVPRDREPPWSEAEMDLLRGREGDHPNSIKKALKVRGFSRTETAIVVKLKRIGLSAAVDEPHCHNARDLGVMMGVDGKTVARWIEKGWLKARMVGEASATRAEGNHWSIHRREIRRFIMENAAAVDLRKVDKFWFIDLLGGPANGVGT